MSEYKAIMKTTQDIHLNFSLRNGVNGGEIVDYIDAISNDMVDIIWDNVKCDNGLNDLWCENVSISNNEINILFRARVDIECVGDYTPESYDEPAYDEVVDFVTGWIDGLNESKIFDSILSLPKFDSYVDESTISIILDDIDEGDFEWEPEDGPDYMEYGFRY